VVPDREPSEIERDSSMAESKQHWLDRNRPPRVQITYDVETGGAIEKKEIPFVVGVMSDLSGPKPGAVAPKLKDRKFIEIDGDNFNDFLKSINPGVKVSGFADEIRFEKIDHFHPDELVERVPELKALLTMRQNLNDLLAKADGNDDLITELQNLLKAKATTPAPHG
jgi:type VI secretion system protein ImpB